jgi:hypothetical protein
VSRKSWPLSSIRIAAGQAIAEGKAIVTCDQGVLVLAYHPLSRIAPSVEGDGFDLATEDGCVHLSIDMAGVCFGCGAQTDHHPKE